jgi:hypothetical protein
MKRFPKHLVLPRRRLSRRAFLGGAAAAMTLPWLEAMTPWGGRARADGEGCRALFYYVPNGFHMPEWTPTAEGAGYTLPRILAPLAGLQDELLVLSNLANAPGNEPGVPGDHAQGTGAFLTCRTPYRTAGSDISVGISVDQVAAGAIGGATTFRSLQLGTEGGGSTGGCDSGYSCAYSRNISWAGEATPLPKMTNPRLVFDRLFAGWDASLTAEAIARRRAYRLSVLDQVVGDANTLSATLGAADRAKLDEYLTGVRELELRIETADETPVCDPGPMPPVDFTYEEHVLLMSDLMVLALRCDATRLISFMLGNASSNRNYSFIGAPGAHHQLSHHQGDAATQELLTQIGTWEIQQLAYLLDGLRAVQEGEGTLLDNTVVYFSSEIADGDAHQHHDLPVLLAGRGGGALNPGRHIALPDREPLANLYLTLLQMLGVEEATFGADGTTALDLS